MLILLTLPSFTRLGKLTVGDDTDSSELLVRDSGSMFIADRHGFEVNGLLGNRGLPLNGFILLSFWRHATKDKKENNRHILCALIIVHLLISKNTRLAKRLFARFKMQ